MDLQTLPEMSRRELVALLAGGAGAAAGGRFLLDDATTAAETVRLGGEEARRLAEAHAPTLYFGAREKWYPTDPRPYVSEQDGEAVVDGFDALDGYTADAREADGPPRPTAFYQARSYPDTSLVCVQYWFYSAFDQFSTNFHWHDWEVLHAFIDRSADGRAADSGTTTDAAATGTPVLFVASAHSRNVPNNEHLDPPAEPAAVISEVGSHSSTLGVNAEPETFQRTSLGELAADISNNPEEIVSGQSSLPMAYGLPRDEGVNLPYAIPELDGERLPDLEQLPNVRAADLLADDVTVESYGALANPPERVPERESADAFVPGARADAEGDVTYELVDIDDVRDITDFTGPELSFSFRVPQFAEDAFAEHLSTPGIPWEQVRFRKPTTDISDPQHRAALANRYEPITAGGSVSRILGAVREATNADESPGSNGVSLLVPSVETVALLESEPEAVPSFSGVIAIGNPPAGEHRFTVNGAGMAPYSQAVQVDGDGDTRVGVEGAVPMASNEDAVKVEGRTEDDSAIAALAVEDDFAGPVYDASPPGPDSSFGVYAHRDGAYTADVRNENGQRGSLRVNPDADDEQLALDAVETGKAALTDYLVRFLAETRAQAAVFEDGTPAGIDDVPTGQDVTDEVVTDTAAAARENAGDIVEDGGDPASSVGGSETDTVTGTGRGAGDTDGSDTVTDAAPTETSTGTPPTKTGTATATDAADDDETVTAGKPVGRGFSGVLKSIDASLLVALGARKNVQSGNVDQADKRLQALRRRLNSVQATIEESDGLAEKLGPFAVKRTERMLPRVEAALDAEP